MLRTVYFGISLFILILSNISVATPIENTNSHYSEKHVDQNNHQKIFGHP